MTVEQVVVKSSAGHQATLYHGDSYEVVKDIRGIDCVITDPPYLHAHMGGGGCFSEGPKANPKIMEATKGGALGNIIDSYDIGRCFDLWLATGAKTIVTFCSNAQIEETLRVSREREMMATVMFWWKYNACPFVNNTWWPDVEYFIHHRLPGAFMNNDVDNELKRRCRKRPSVTAEEFNGLGDGLHPTAKPVGLIQELVTVLCPEGGTVLDPFMGSGSTGVAAMNRKCNFVGIERAPCAEDEGKYFQLAENRIRTAATQKRMF
jgi:site-specific DNA-methyltransferase (adenine-specific)